MQHPPEAAPTFLRSPDGRVRLGWRLSLFIVLAAFLAIATAVVLPPGDLTGSFAIFLGAAVSGAVVLTLDGRSPVALGFHLGRSALPEAALGLLLGSAVAVVVLGLMVVAGVLEWEAQEGGAAAWLAGGASALLFLALPAAAEETLLRGYPIQAIAEARGPLAALTVTSALFGALHVTNPNVTTIGALNVTVAGAFLGVVYLKTLSLWWATGAHLGWNWTHGYLADVPVSGMELMDAPLYEGVVSGPDWLGGGSFGPEGSLVATVVVLAATVACWKASWLRPSGAALRARPLAAPTGLRVVPGAHA
jgi:membrane protease YdiL (CAAX protease family)